MYDEGDERIHPCRGCEDYEEPNKCKTNGGCGLTMNIYYKQSDITASLSELMVSPWALECDSTRAAGIQEALHLIQDIINGEVPESMKIPAADVVEIACCKDCRW